MLRGALLLLNMTGVPRLVMGLMLDRRVPLKLKLILPAAILYIVSPFDLIPDILPALGRIDDILVLVMALAMFLGMTPRDVVTERLRNSRADKDIQRTSDESDQTIIEGEYRLLYEDDEPKHR